MNAAIMTGRLLDITMSKLVSPEGLSLRIKCKQCATIDVYGINTLMQEVFADRIALPVEDQEFTFFRPLLAIKEDKAITTRDAGSDTLAHSACRLEILLDLSYRH